MREALIHVISLAAAKIFQLFRLRLLLLERWAGAIVVEPTGRITPIQAPADDTKMTNAMIGALMQSIYDPEIYKLLIERHFDAEKRSLLDRKSQS